MTAFNSIFGAVFHLMFYLFQGMSPWIGMIVVSLLTALLMLFFYRYTSNQKGIKKVKNRIKAHLLELRLYKDEIATTFKAQGNLLISTFRYMGYNIVPMLFMMVPVVLIIIQLIFWFEYGSLNIGQTAILKVKLNETLNPMNVELSLEPPSGIAVETPPLRIAEDREICWRLRAEKVGVHDLALRIQNQVVTKTVSVGGAPLAKISPVRVQKNFLDQLLYPAESPIPKDSPVKRIEISYPYKSMSFFGFKLHWLIPYFLLSIIFGFALKGFFKIEI
jgi:uncharacterized membrane protein (DUF106 family)